MTSEATFDRLVGLVYDSIQQPAAWSALFDALHGVVGIDAWVHLDCGAGIVLADAGGERVNSTRSHQYQAHYGAIDPRLPLMLGTPDASLVSCVRHLDDAFVSRNEFFQDFLIPAGLRYAMGGTVLRADGHQHVVGLLRGPERGRFEDWQEAFMGRLMPHMRRALQLRGERDAQRARAEARAQALAALRIGMFVLDGAGRIVDSDAFARAMLDAGSPVVAKAGVLACARKSRQTAFRAGLDGCARSGRPVVVMVECARTPARRYGVSFLPSQAAGGITCLVTELDPGRIASERHVMAALGLTPAEARIARALAEGETLDGYAGRVGVRLSTVRSQLRDIFEKTGFDRQSALVRAVAAVPPLD